MKVQLVAVPLMVFASFFVSAARADAQSACVSLVSSDLKRLVYPPIAKAAHVEGKVILLVTFAHDGAVTDSTVVSGPAMLQRSVTAFVKGWKAEPSAGSRRCPIVITYQVTGPPSAACGTPAGDAVDKFVEPPVQSTDAQHVTVSSKNTCFYTQY